MALMIFFISWIIKARAAALVLGPFVVVGPVLVAVECCRVEGAALAAASVPNAKKIKKIKLN